MNVKPVLETEWCSWLSSGSDNKLFRIITNQRFTRGGHFEVNLKCESQAARNKWLVALRKAVASDKFQR
eukprot:m.272520 g.272520  ORF g.272520 m.272520 type:complete len:69 (-) comp19332_c1_seq3:251-457(-)